MRLLVPLLALLAGCVDGPMSASEFSPKPGDASGHDRDWAFSGCALARSIGGRRSVEDDVRRCMEAKGYRWNKPD